MASCESNSTTTQGGGSLPATATSPKEAYPGGGTGLQMETPAALVAVEALAAATAAGDKEEEELPLADDE